MRQPAPEEHAEQLGLFRPMVTRPLWSGLPAAVREEVLRLLAQMIGEHAQECDLADREEAESDE